MEMYLHATRADSAELGTEKPAVQPRPKNYLEGVTIENLKRSKMHDPLGQA